MKILTSKSPAFKIFSFTYVKLLKYHQQNVLKVLELPEKYSLYCYTIIYYITDLLLLIIKKTFYRRQRVAVNE